MELETFTPHHKQADSLSASDAVDKPLIVSVKQRRDNIVTQYKPDGATGIIIDAADINTGQIWRDILWLNGAIVDALTPYVGKTVAITLTYTASARGGNRYISVQPLTGTQLDAAQHWAQQNPDAFTNNGGNESEINQLINKIR